ncbi:hypothetical protein AVEN_48534-1 [Araneus ventricosus]|uniref:Uncharacterized protein n=1 Tax=Araneus ventricosus TaxID=182803 RepID=A0A4Y2AM65_ARAVE|nr:hypothetical protein AVEN_48534-1 [Araneus ventricosus]
MEETAFRRLRNTIKMHVVECNPAPNFNIAPGNTRMENYFRPVEKSETSEETTKRRILLRCLKERWTTTFSQYQLLKDPDIHKRSAKRRRQVLPPRFKGPFCSSIPTPSAILNLGSCTTCRIQD